jgi:hypothetical protein
MAGRPSAVTQAGLDAQLTQKGDGKWQIVLTDDEGTEVFSRAYTTSHIAKQSARDWVTAELPGHHSGDWGQAQEACLSIHR